MGGSVPPDLFKTHRRIENIEGAAIGSQVFGKVVVTEGSGAFFRVDVGKNARSASDAREIMLAFVSGVMRNNNSWWAVKSYIDNASANGCSKVEFLAYVRQPQEDIGSIGGTSFSLNQEFSLEITRHKDLYVEAKITTDDDVMDF